jgi:hypothetical protein
MGNSNEGPVASSSNAPNIEHGLLQKRSRMFEAQVERLASFVTQAISGMTRAEYIPRSGD